MNKKRWKTALCGAFAGVLNGLFGAGGGMILIPLLRKLTDVKPQQIFPVSVSIMVPLCILSLWIGSAEEPLPWAQALPYLIGAIPGGLAAAWLDGKLPVKWLHRIFGGCILIGGIRYLWP